MPYILLTLVNIAWGGSYTIGRTLVGLADPLIVAWFRFLVASATFFVLETVTSWRRRRAGSPALLGGGWVPATGRRRGVLPPPADPAASPAASPASPPARRDWPTYALLGLTGIFAYNLCFFYGLVYTTAVESSLITSAGPALIALIGIVLLGEALSTGKGVGIALSIGGVALIVLGAAPAVTAGAAGSGAAASGVAASGAAGPSAGAGGRLLGDALILGSMLAWAAYSVAGKKIVDRVGALAATARGTYWGMAFLTIPVVFRVARLGSGVLDLGATAWAGILYLALICTVFGFVAWNQAIGLTEVSRASVFLNVTPLSALIIAFFALGELPTLVQLLGGAVVVAGVYVASNGRAGAGGGERAGTGAGERSGTGAGDRSGGRAGSGPGRAAGTPKQDARAAAPGFRIRRATPADTDALVEMRVALFQEIGRLGQDPAEVAWFREANRRYLARSLGDGSFVSWVAEAVSDGAADDGAAGGRAGSRANADEDSAAPTGLPETGRLVAMSGLVYFSVPPQPENPNGLEAYVMNMYVVPDHRRRGVARAVLDAVIADVKASPSRHIHLLTTPAGRTLYSGAGFVPNGRTMELSW